MKITYKENAIQFTPESFGDQMYIAKFIKESVENEVDECIHANFRYSDDRMSENAPKGGGWLNPKNIVESLTEAEDEDDGKPSRKVAICEINGLRITNFHI